MNWGRCSGSSLAKLTPETCSVDAKGVGDVSVSSFNNDVVIVKDKVKSSSKVAAHGYLHKTFFLLLYSAFYSVI